MSARGRTVTASAMFDPNSAGPETDHGEQSALDLLTQGTLDIEGRLVDASNATLYCTINTTGPDPRAASGYFL